MVILHHKLKLKQLFVLVLWWFAVYNYRIVWVQWELSLIRSPSTVRKKWGKFTQLTHICRIKRSATNYSTRLGNIWITSGKVVVKKRQMRRRTLSINYQWIWGKDWCSNQIPWFWIVVLSFEIILVYNLKRN